jgi:hypothetical protein
MKKQKSKRDKRKKLLLHACCADCTLKSIQKLAKTDPNLQPTLFFSNSNIHPRSEYLARQTALKQIATKKGITIIGANWSPQKWYEAINWNPNNNNFKRCRNCWLLRLRNTAHKAREIGIKIISTTLLASHYQNHKIIRETGQKLAREYDLKFISFKIQKNAYKTKGFYKQNYCGCIYSLMKRYKNKFLQKAKD